MVDLTATRPQVKRAAPFASHEGGQTEAASATPLNALVPPSTDGMDKLYCQLVKIYAIAPTSSPVQFGVGWQKPVVEPSAARMTPPPQTDFLPQASPWRWGQLTEPQAYRQARQRDVHAQPECRAWDPHQGEHNNQMGHCHHPKGPRRRRSKAACTRHTNNRPSKQQATFSGTPPRSCATSPPSTPPSMRWTNFAMPQAVGRRPQAATRRHRSMLPSMMPRMSHPKISNFRLCLKFTKF
jgi:hypothetical protein